VCVYASRCDNFNLWNLILPRCKHTNIHVFNTLELAVKFMTLSPYIKKLFPKLHTMKTTPPDAQIKKMKIHSRFYFLSRGIEIKIDRERIGRECEMEEMQVRSIHQQLLTINFSHFHFHLQIPCGFSLTIF
jgi:hypothetical protein